MLEEAERGEGREGEREEGREEGTDRSARWRR